MRELAGRAPNGAVLIDTLTRALKERGFSRPPGSPRLITRLRRIREIEVSRTGMITLVGTAAAPTRAHEPPASDAAAEAAELDADAASDEPISGDEGTPGNEAARADAAPGSSGRRRRRRRRGGRGRRGGGAPAAAPAPA
ncbi:MAG: hypothetical protein WEG40_08940 [Candidatus Rokuibacteriota bacterium]